MCTIALAIGAVSAVGSLMQGQAAKSAANAQAAASEQNARMADEQARDAMRRGAQDELKLRRQMSALQGRQRAMAAASGVETDAGSPLALQEASRREGDQDAAVIRFNAEREAWGYGVQATNYRNAASAARAGGRNAMTAGIIGTGTSLLRPASGYMAGKAAQASVSPWDWNFAEMRGESMSGWQRSFRKMKGAGI